MALRAVANDGDGLILQDAEVAVALIVDFCHGNYLLRRTGGKIM